MAIARQFGAVERAQKAALSAYQELARDRFRAGTPFLQL